MFHTNSTNYNYNTRNKNQIHTPKLVKTEHSIIFLGEQILNAIPDHTKQSNTFNTIPIFKGKLKTIFIEMDIVLLMYNMTILLIQQ